MIMHPDKARANLGLITQLLQHNIPQAPPKQAPQTEITPSPETKPEPTAPPPDPMETKLTEMEASMNKKLDDLKSDLTEKHKLELENLRLQIQQALSEDDEQIETPQNS